MNGSKLLFARTSFAKNRTHFFAKRSIAEKIAASEKLRWIQPKAFDIPPASNGIPR